jgi:hypothetical protein
MGLYGNMLTNFQALFIDLQSFDMKAKTNSGYDTTKDKNGNNSVIIDFRGCFQNLTANEIKSSNGNLIIVISGNLWSNTQLILGNFVKNPEDNLTYRLKRNNPWVKEAGFYYYDVTQVTGDDGSLVVEPNFNTGSKDLA